MSAELPILPWEGETQAEPTTPLGAFLTNSGGERSKKFNALKQWVESESYGGTGGRGPVVLVGWGIFLGCKLEKFGPKMVKSGCFEGGCLGFDNLNFQLEKGCGSSQHLKKTLLRSHKTFPSVLDNWRYSWKRKVEPSDRPQTGVCEEIQRRCTQIMLPDAALFISILLYLV